MGGAPNNRRPGIGGASGRKGASVPRRAFVLAVILAIATLGLAAVAAPASTAAGAASAAAAPDLASAPPHERIVVCFVSPGDRSYERTVRLPAAAAKVLLSATPSYPGPCAVYGERSRLGEGVIRTYAQLHRGKPLAVGVTFPRSTFEDLPTAPHDGHHCYDANGDGAIDDHHECVGGHERVMFLPERLRDEVDTPFQWVLMNWNPVGHHPPETYGVPHFDFHFYIQDLEERNAIGAGPCGLLVDCDDYARGAIAVPDAHLPRDYMDVGAVEAGMGNHLIDTTSPEFSGQPFTHTFIYGAFDGRISFYEPMITLEWFKRLFGGDVASRCFALKLPTAWKPAGWYPTEYCIRYRANRADYTVSLEGFVLRDADSAGG